MLRSLTQTLLRLLGYELHKLPSSDTAYYREHLIFRKIRRWILRLDVKHVYGPKKIDYAEDELVVVCVVRNGQLYLKAFIDHYVSLGVKHIVFLDNGSTDETEVMATSYENVTVLQSKLPFDKYNLIMKEYLIRRFGRNRWILCVDIDEFFLYPSAKFLSLDSFLQYLNTKSYTAVVAQMLDMFADQPLPDGDSKHKEFLPESFDWFDLSDISKVNYVIDSSTISNRRIKRYYGGIRKTIFGLDKVNLTKHPLVFVDDKIELLSRNSHFVYHAHVADFTCVLVHYKFVSTFYEYALRATQEENMPNSAEYQAYIRVLKSCPKLKFKQETSIELKDVDDLIDLEFLIVSEDYEGWAEKHKNIK